MIGSTLSKGDAYKHLPSLAGIYIFDDVLFPTLTEVHSSYQLRRAIPNDGYHLHPNILRFDFIELPKISGLNPTENPLLSAWVKFLAAKSVQELAGVAHSVPEIKQLVEELNKMSADKDFINVLNKHEFDKMIAQRANAEAMSDARQEGRQ